MGILILIKESQINGWNLDTMFFNLQNRKNTSARKQEPEQKKQVVILQ